MQLVFRSPSQYIFAMYHWRKITESDRKQILELRKVRNLPWHNPPHLDFNAARQYLISSSCYEHAPVLGKDPERMTKCEAEVLRICDRFPISNEIRAGSGSDRPRTQRLDGRGQCKVFEET